MTKKAKTPRIGVPPPGFVRVVMDYPADRIISINYEMGCGHRVGHSDNRALAAWGDLIRIIRRTEPT